MKTTAYLTLATLTIYVYLSILEVVGQLTGVN